MDDRHTVLTVAKGPCGYEVTVTGDTRTVMLALGHLCTEICKTCGVTPDTLGERVAGQVHIIAGIKEQ